MTHSPNRYPLVDHIATTLKQRGLHSAALALLEAGQPLAFIGSQLLWVAQPTMALLWPSSQVKQWSQILEDPAALDALKVRLAHADEVAV